jgi:hypothetical protein
MVLSAAMMHEGMEHGACSMVPESATHLLSVSTISNRHSSIESSASAISTMPTVRKAVIPAAGYGTRFLPIAKAVPKEMLPHNTVWHAVMKKHTMLKWIMSRLPNGSRALQREDTSLRCLVLVAISLKVVRDLGIVSKDFTGS